MRNFWRSIFINNRFYAGLGFFIVLMILGQFYHPVFLFAQLTFALFVTLVAIDFILLFHKGSQNKILGKRQLPERFSNGDINQVHITITNHFGYHVRIKVIDELPVQLQIRDFLEILYFKPYQEKKFTYNVKPVVRGDYHFGALNVLVDSPLKLITRRFIFDSEAMVKVYPSFIEMRNFELLAISNRLTEVGIKKIRKIGHQMEFDQIRDYISGDDYRTINWKATARKGHLMVNQYQDEKSQQVYNLIDMGRNMKMAV